MIEYINTKIYFVQKALYRTSAGGCSNMMDVRQFAVGDIVKMKKAHPCGANQWEVVRTGVDFMLKCVQCSRQVMIPRIKFERAVRGILKKAEEPQE